jgi:hypothetical protein
MTGFRPVDIEVGDEQMTASLIEEEMKKLTELFTKPRSHELSAKELETSELIKKVQLSLNTVESSLNTESRTAKLWLQYIYYVDLIKAFIRAERTVN